MLPSIVPSMNNVIELLNNPEGKTLEYKRDLTSGQIAQTLIAFANTAGGTLIIGIEDKTLNIIGVEDPLAMEERITNIIADAITPQILPEVEISSYKDKHIVIVHVYPSPTRPHYLKNKGLENGVYVRIGSTNRMADLNMIQELQRSAMNKTYDEQPVLELDETAIDFEAVSKSFSVVKNLKHSDLITLKLLVKSQNKIVPTVGGILLFGKKREELFTDAWIQVGRFLGKNKTTIIDTMAIHSYPVLAIEEALKFVQKHAMMALEINDTHHHERWSIPLLAVREAVINAVVHADYSQTGSPIRLSIFQDRLEVENPGILPFGVSLEEIMKGVSKLRNRVIGRVFHELKLIEQWGSGIQRMIDLSDEAGVEKPKFEEIGNHFRVTIYIEPKRKPLVDDITENILRALKHKNLLGTQEISEKIKLSTRATRARLASLVEKGLIVPVGSGPRDPHKRFFLKENNITHIKIKKIVAEKVERKLYLECRNESDEIFRFFFGRETLSDYFLNDDGFKGDWERAIEKKFKTISQRFESIVEGIMVRINPNDIEVRNQLKSAKGLEIIPSDFDNEDFRN